ncbi:MAG: hypothetical protein IH876_00095 [Gemmatimonadetes bacterium]|nr:hypothetical protein [Gemmatimonadota bacterium]
MIPRWRSSRAIRTAAAAGALVLAPLAVSPAAAQSIPVSAASNASSLVGVDFLLPIEIDMSQRTDTLQNFVLTLRWDTAVLELVGGGPGKFGQVDLSEDSVAQGVLRIGGTNTRSVGGLFSVAVVRMRPLVAATDTIRVSVDTLTAKTSLADLTSNVVLTDRLYCPALGRWGDPDGNGLINTRDALIALSAAVGLDVSQFNAAMADVDGDGLTQAVDALIILSRALGIDVSGSRLFSIAPGSCAPSTALGSFFLVPGDTTVLTGSRVEYAALATDSSGATVAVGDVFLRVSNERVATVTPNGVVQTLDTGTTVVTAFRSGRADSAQVTLTVVTGVFETNLGRGLFQSDDDSDLKPFGFTFEFYGVQYTDVWINSNGNLTFGASNSDYDHPDVPDGTNVLIAPLYGDFNPSQAGGVFYNTLGTAPNQRFVVTWLNVPEYSPNNTGHSTFQVQLSETTNTVLFLYNGLRTDGINWTFSAPSVNADMDVGISSGTGLFTNSASGAAIPLLDGATILYTPTGGTPADYTETRGLVASRPPLAAFTVTTSSGQQSAATAISGGRGGRGGLSVERGHQPRLNVDEVRASVDALIVKLADVGGADGAIAILERVGVAPELEDGDAKGVILQLVSAIDAVRLLIQDGTLEDQGGQLVNDVQALIDRIVNP